MVEKKPTMLGISHATEISLEINSNSVRSLCDFNANFILCLQFQSTAERKHLFIYTHLCLHFAHYRRLSVFAVAFFFHLLTSRDLFVELTVINMDANVILRYFATLSVLFEAKKGFRKRDFYERPKHYSVFFLSPCLAHYANEYGELFAN